MKKTYYFSHDMNANQDPKMMRLLASWGLVGTGMYWAIIETLHQQEDGKISDDDMDGLIEFYKAVEPKSIDSPDIGLSGINDVLVSIGLLKHENGYYYSERVLKNKELCEGLSRARSYAGKLGASVKWQTDGKPMANDGKPMANDGKPMANDGKPMANDGIRKEKKRKEKKENTHSMREFVQFWAAYPKKIGRASALEAWKSAIPPLDKCLKTLEWQAKSEEWTKEDGRYIPSPVSWISGGRWDDVPNSHNFVKCQSCGHEGMIGKSHSGKITCSKCGTAI